MRTKPIIKQRRKDGNHIIEGYRVWGEFGVKNIYFPTPMTLEEYNGMKK